MFKDIVNYDYSNDACKSFFNGIKDINGVRSKVILPFQSRKAFEFFFMYLNKSKLNDLLNAFSISTSQSDAFK
mgnify:FL=1